MNDTSTTHWLTANREAVIEEFSDPNEDFFQQTVSVDVEVRCVDGSKYVFVGYERDDDESLRTTEHSTAVGQGGTLQVIASTVRLFHTNTATDFDPATGESRPISRIRSQQIVRTFGPSSWHEAIGQSKSWIDTAPDRVLEFRG